MIGDRFQLVAANNLKLPGSCIICGYGGDGRNYIDFGVQVARIGRLYFCVDCFKDCERSVGRVSYSDSSSPGEFRTDLLDDTAPKPVTKRGPGRPKKANNRTAKQSAE